MGVVYRAHDTRLNRDVAIKVIVPAAAGDEAARARLLREARNASALNHPHVCTVYDVQTRGDQLFIVMEYVPGKTLFELVRPGGLPAADCFHFGAQIVDALEHAHQRSIVHRDLKSANILVTDNRRVKVLDFGLAKHFEGDPDGDETTDSLTRRDVIVGTVAYMAPERFRVQPAGPAADVWALGVVLYEMATGSLPFKGASNVEVASAILEHPPAPFRIRLPVDLEEVILQCLEKDPRERPSPAAVRLALDRSHSPEHWTMRPSQRSEASQRNPSIRSLAVLPLKNLSGDSSQEYLADGLTETLITTIAKVSVLRVISRTSVMRYKEGGTPLGQIAKELKIDAAVEGSVLRSGDTIRISAQLVDARTDTTLWGEIYDRQFTDVLAVHHEIAQAIAHEVRATVTIDERKDLAREHAVNADAFEEYLKGRYLWNRRGAPDVRSAMQHFERAIERDPRFATAQVGLADCHISLVSYGLMAPKQGMPLARRLLARALEIDPMLAAAHASTAMVHFFADWHVEQAEQCFERAIRLNPSYPISHQWRAAALTACGRYHDALAELSKARELDPLSVAIVAHTAWAHYYGRDYEQALRACRHALDLQPDFHQALVFSGMVYERMGMLTEALANLEKAVEIAGRDHYGSLTLAYVYARAGRHDRARGILDRVIDPQRYVNAYSVAVVYAALGDLGEAWRWLNTGFEERAWHITSLGVDPKLDVLHDDPRFIDMVRKIGISRPPISTRVKT
jgi:serine/threonine-protein kinase